MSKYKLCRGFRDLMPADYKKYNFLQETIEEVSNLYGYKMVETPCIEDSNLFSSCYKEDISHKLFTIDDRFIGSASLNYDSSVSILRSIVESKLYVDKSLPLKLMYLKRVYKYNRKNPSEACKYELGFECIGDKSIYLDVENLLHVMKIINFLGLALYNLKIKNCGESDEYYSNFKHSLNNLGIDYIEEEFEVKEYYTGIAYQIDVDSYDCVVSGGRYDNLVDIIGGVSVDCIGAHFDFDKLVAIMEENEFFPNFKEEIDFYLIPVNEKCFEYALTISEELRELGAVVEIHYKEYDLKRLDDLLDRIDVMYSLVIDEEDVKKKTIKVRNSLSKQQSCVLLKDFIKDLQNLEKHHHEEE